MERERPDHTTNLTAFLFCRDVIEEKRGISPFRLLDSADVNIPPLDANIAALTVWPRVEVNVFIGFACYHTPAEHEHFYTLKVYAPNGVLLGASKDQKVNPGGESTNAYRNVVILLPGKLEGAYKFELHVDDELRATAFFKVRHIADQSSPPDSTVPPP